MIYPAEITSVDYVNYSCTVNIPDLRGVNDGPNPVVCSAYFSEPPGTNKGYKTGSKVWVAFIRGEKHAPVVLGLMTDQANELNSAILGKSLNIADTAELPLNTTFSGAAEEYNNLTKIINKLKAATNFLETHNNLEFKLQETSSSDSGGGEGSYDYDHSLLEAALFSTITVSQEIEDLGTEFPLGRVLFVQNDLGLSYPLWTEIKVYPVPSLAANNVEFSNAQINKEYKALPGIWKVKTLLNGAMLVQRCMRNRTQMPSYVNIEMPSGSTQRFNLFNSEGGAALSYYWEQPADSDNLVLKGIETAKLKFITSSNTKVISESTSTEIIAIQLPDGTPIKTFSNTDPCVDSIAVLNLRGVNLTNKNGIQGKLHTTANNGLFAHSKKLEYIYLNDYYNNRTNTLNMFLFYSATNLKEVYIPDSIVGIEQHAFNGTTSLSSVINLENSKITSLQTQSFSNAAVDVLYLPSKVDKITFNLKSLGNHNNLAEEQGRHIKTLFVNSKIDLKSNFETTPPQSCFYNYTARDGINKMTFVNQFTTELIYTGTKEQVKALIAESDLTAFFRTWYHQDITCLEDIENFNIDDYLVDGSRGYTIGSATIEHPTIVYNYKE